MADETPEHTSMPIYAQVAERLSRDIASGRLLDGERLAPERALAQQMDVSVGTLRKSLAILEEKSMLRRVQGSGNYVDAAGVRDSIYAMFRLELTDGRGLPRAQVLSVDPADAPPQLARGRPASASRIRRLRFLNKIAIAVEEIFLHGRVGALSRSDVSESMYQTYQAHFELWIARAEDRVGVSTAPEWTPPELGLGPNATVGYVERLSWADGPEPVEFSRTWFNPDRAVYVQRLT